MIEREIKFMISDNKLDKYKRILNSFVTPTKILQINYYYDTPDFHLNSLGKTLRVRQKKNNLILQYKYDKNLIGIERICKEYEMELQLFPMSILSNILPDNVSESFLVYNYIGSLITERLDYFYNGTIISLDTNYYLGEHDCELEIEYAELEKAENVIRLIPINEAEIKTMGKYSRYARVYQKLVNNG